MKLNNKGFAISSIMYIILVLAVVLIALTLALLSSRKLVLDKLKNEVINSIQGAHIYTYRETLGILKEEAITYATTNNITKDSIQISNLESSIDEEIISDYKLDDKYLTMVSNENTYDVYLGESKTITDISKSNDSFIDIVDYKISGNSVQKILPSEYQQVEYIESTGTQYLIIDYIASAITSSKIKFQITDTSKTAFLFGSRSAGGSKFYGLNWGGTVPYTYYNSYSYGAITTVEADTKVHTIYKNKGDFYLDDTYITTVSAASFTTPSNMNVFAAHNDGTDGYLPPLARIYYLQFYDNDTLMVDLIPCYRKSDNVIGMYDLVTNTFYTNKGTGTFLKGGNAPTPEIPIEIESVGDESENLLSVDNYQLTGVALDKTIFSGSLSLPANLSWEIDFTPNNQAALFSYVVDGTTKYVTADMGSVKITGTELTQIKILNWPQNTGNVTNLKLTRGKYKIPVKVSGKNFALNDSIENPDLNYSSSGGGTAKIQYSELEEGYYTTNHRKRDFGNLKPGIYTLSLLAKLRSDGGSDYAILTTTNDGYGYQALSKSKLTNEYQLFTYTFEVVKERNFQITIYNTLYFKDIQLEKGSIATAYESYVQPVTTNIYLDEPLRKINDNVDYMKFQKKKVFRKIEEMALGNYTWSTYSQSNGYTAFYTDAEPEIVNTTDRLSNFIEYYQFSSGKLDRESYALSGSVWPLRKYVVFSDNRGFTTSTLQDFLKSIDARIYFVPTNVREETVEIPKVNTNNGASIIEIGTDIAPSSVEFTVVEKIKQL